MYWRNSKLSAAAVRKENSKTKYCLKRLNSFPANNTLYKPSKFPCQLFSIKFQAFRHWVLNFQSFFFFFYSFKMCHIQPTSLMVRAAVVMHCGVCMGCMQDDFTLLSCVCSDIRAKSAALLLHHLWADSCGLGFPEGFNWCHSFIQILYPTD